VTVYVRKKVLPHAPDPTALSDRAGYISHAEFESTYGADPHDIALIESFAKRNGLTVLEADRARKSIRLSGEAGAFSKAFGVELENKEFEGAIYHQPSGAVRIPAELAPIVTTVLGLDNIPVARPRLPSTDQ
jgi:kumamolisin